MSQNVVAVGLLIVLVAIMAIWLLVQWSKGPRKVFRSGYADPERAEFPPEERGTHAPETIKTDTRERVESNTLDEQVAALIEGDPDDTSPPSPTIDEVAADVVDEEVQGEHHLRRDIGEMVPEAPERQDGGPGPSAKDAFSEGAREVSELGALPGAEPDHRDAHDWSSGGYSGSGGDWSKGGFTSGEGRHGR